MRLHRPVLRLLPLLLLAACVTRTAPPIVALGAAPSADQQLPLYVRRGFEPFSRTNAVAIAQREWRAFGSVVDDGPPDRPLPHDSRLDQQPGLWQRVSDYWWQSQDNGTREAEWGSKYSPSGTQYTGDPPAWSAAFISYVMRTAGAGFSFPYSPLHADYINAAARNEGALHVERPETYVPQPGDLVCHGRGNDRRITFDDLPSQRFLSHCDMIVNAIPGQLTVIGGNVTAGVTMKHIPTTPDGKVADTDGRAIDSRYPWFVVIRVSYDAP